MPHRPATSWSRLTRGDRFDVFVTTVIDGDTVDVLQVETGELFRLRLATIDAMETEQPGEPGQPYAREATNFLRRLALGRTFTLTITTSADFYGRVVGILRRGHRRSVNHQMTAAGWAFYRPYRRNERDPRVQASERDAQANHRGMWKHGDPGERPWDYRARMRQEQGVAEDVEEVFQEPAPAPPERQAALSRDPYYQRRPSTPSPKQYPTPASPGKTTLGDRIFAVVVWGHIVGFLLFGSYMCLTQ